MDVLKYTRLFSKFNDDIDTSNIIKACVYLPNEGLVMYKSGSVYRVNNTGFLKLEIFTNKNVIDFAYGKSVVNNKLVIFILVLTENEVYGWGANRYRQVSFNDENSVLKPQKIPLPRLVKLERFISISCVYGHCMALTDKNCVILWGNNSHGQIGNDTISPIESPYRIKFKLTKNDRTVFKDKRIIVSESKILSIACSARNSYVLLENGNVYGWGENSAGQLGSLHVEYYRSPQILYGRIKQFEASGSHALALRRDGVLFGSGYNAIEQTRVYNDKRFCEEPYRFDKKVVTCATRNNLSMALTEDDKCFIWGKYGQIEVPTVRVKIDKNKVDQSTQVNLVQGNSGNIDINVTDLSNFESTVPEEPVSVRNDQTNKTIVEDNQESNAVSNEDKSNTDNNNKETADKKSEEKRKIEEIIRNGKIENYKLELTLEKPIEIKCKSFSKIIAKRFEEMRFSVDSDDLSNGYRSDDENDLIDLSNFIVVIYEYEKIVVERAEKKDDSKSEDKQSEKLKKIHERLETLEQNKSTVQNIHFGNKTKTVLFNKSSVSEVDGFTLSGINQTGVAEESIIKT